MKIDPKFKLRTLAGESVLFLPGQVGGETSKLLALNEASALLYQQFKDKDFGIDDIVDFILSEYEIDEPTARNDAREWVETLKKHGVIC